MKKLKKLFLLVLCLMPFVFIFNACSFSRSENVFITDIVKTEVVGDVATYTIYYSNGKTSIFTVTNGKDGVDGKDGKDAESLTIQSIKDYCNANGLDFEEFLKTYLTINEEHNNITIQPNESVVQTATNKAIQSAVTIWCEFPFEDFYHNKSTELACGAGAIYQMEEQSEYSYIITNYHVVYYPGCATSNNTAQRITLFQYGSDEAVYESGATLNGFPTYSYGHGGIEAEYVGGSLNYDIAVLRVKTADLLTYNEYATETTIAEEYNLGETAIAIGNPECEGFSVTSGIISVVSETISMTGADEVTQCEFRVMRIDTAVNGGNSGGGLFNTKGELIGIVNAKAVSSDIDNIAFALPIDNVTKVVDNLIYYYETSGQPSQIKKLDLEIQYTAENSHSVYDPSTNRTTILDDLKVTSVTLFGVGHLVGLQAGDIIKSITINGTKHNITRAYQLDDWLLTVRSGDELILTINRGQITKELKVSSATGISEIQLDSIN